MLVNTRITPQKTYYEILSVKEDASIDEIRTGYRAALLSTHPDKLPNRPFQPSDFNNKEQEFIIVQKAWEVLSNPHSKSQYDNKLAASRQKIDVIANEIGLEDMNYEINDDGECELVHPCRCGDCYKIGSLELREIGVFLGENGDVELCDCNEVSVILQCASCSLKVRLLIEVNV